MAGPPSKCERWRYASASALGSSHQKTAGICQDAHSCRLVSLPSGEETLAVFIADGAGSARFADQGAQFACKHFGDRAVAFLHEGYAVGSITREVVADWLRTFQFQLQLVADDAAAPLREFACTVLGAVFDDWSAVYFQIGDGVIAILDPTTGEYQWIFWPDRGEYANTTYFATESSAFEQLQFDARAESPTEIALLTDGLQALALHYETQTAHSPFFRGLFTPLRRSAPGHDAALSEHLALFLNSQRVNLRTDDDKTAVLATRIVEGHVGSKTV